MQSFLLAVYRSAPKKGSRVGDVGFVGGGAQQKHAESSDLIAVRTKNFSGLRCLKVQSILVSYRTLADLRLKLSLVFRAKTFGFR